MQSTTAKSPARKAPMSSLAKMAKQPFQEELTEDMPSWRRLEILREQKALEQDLDYLNHFDW